MNTKFYFENEDIEVEDRYKYLGIIFSRSDSFAEANNYIAEQGNKAMFLL